MRIFIDIGHPAHVHYFKHFIKIMKQKGHTFFISTRDKECTLELMNSYNIPFFSRGKGQNGAIGKLLYMLKADYILYKEAKNFKPDIFLSFASPYAAQVSTLLNKPHIAFDDTEHAKFAHLMYVPFSKAILTPECFTKPMGKNHIKYNGYIELCSLHPNYFKPNPNILKELKIKENEKYVMLRFVSWKANHDIGQSGLTLKLKREIISKLTTKYKVFISSEKVLPAEFEKHRIPINPEYMHDILAFASMFIGEGATMASECAMLGTPAIYVNSLDAGTLQEQEKYGLLFGFRNSTGVLEKLDELLAIENLKQQFQTRRQKMLSDKIDVTAFMVWFIENYPKSKKVMQSNPDYQYNFR